MSLVRPLPWSNSRRSWIERGSAVFVLGSGVFLWFAASRLPTAIQLALWAGWALSAALLTRLGYLPLFGPVLFYDMVRTARRNRYVVIRTLYAAFLLLLLFWVYSLVSESGVDNRAMAARMAEDFFETMMVVQLVAVVLLTPAYLGGAIAEEKERRTLEFILATDLRNQEVILSKLGSRLASLALFLLTGLPILSLLQFLGGIDPNLVLLGFAVTGLTMLGTGSVSLFHSVLLRRPRDAIGATYLMLVAYLALATLCLVIKVGPGWKWALQDWFPEGSKALDAIADVIGVVTDVINAGSPIALIVEVGLAGPKGTLATTLPGLLRNYAAFHVVVAALCLGWSMARLRVVGLRQTVGRVRTARETRMLRPPVGELPMLWKETLEGRLKLSWPLWLAGVPLVLLTIGIGGYICSDYLLVHLADLFFGNWARLRDVVNPNQHSLARDMNVWARITGGCVACIGLMWTAVRASTGISSERDRQSFDALVTTQLHSEGVLGAKLLGSLIGARLGFIWLAAILLLACLTGGLHPLALPLTLGAWLIYATFFAMVGLFCSMVCSTSTRATVATVLFSIGLGVGHWLIWFCLAPLFFFAHSAGPDTAAEYIMKFQVGMTPPAVLIMLMHSYPDLAEGFSPNHYGEWLSYCLLGLFLWGSATVVFWFGSLAPRFREAMRREPAHAEGLDASRPVRHG